VGGGGIAVGGSVTGAPLEPWGKAELEEAGGRRRREGVLKANGGGDGGSRRRVTIMMWWATAGHMLGVMCDPLHDILTLSIYGIFH
jgi:hypothetical protein